MGFLSGGLFFSTGPCVFGETWKPRPEWTGILLSSGGRHSAFTLNGVVAKVMRGVFAEMRSTRCEISHRYTHSVMVQSPESLQGVDMK